LKTISFILHFSVPWPTAGTSSCPHCSFAIHIYMLGWTTAGWASHRHVSIQGHIWSLCTMFTAYRFAAFQQLYSVQNSRTTKSAQRINAHILQFMKDESSRAYYQERYHPPPLPPENATSNKQRSNMYVNSVSKMNHVWNTPEELVRQCPTSLCHKHNTKRIFILHNINVVEPCSNLKDVQIIRGPESPCNQKMTHRIMSITFCNLTI
jgi:hypothetical protein